MMNRFQKGELLAGDSIRHRHLRAGLRRERATLEAMFNASKILRVL